MLLFYLLMVGHPLVGARELDSRVWDEQAEGVLFGRDPLFVFDPLDDSNRRCPAARRGAGQLAPLPDRICERCSPRPSPPGCSDARNGRVRESHWRAELVKARDLLFTCGECSAANFFDAVDPKRACWNCGRPSARPVTLTLPAGMLVLDRDTAIAAHHVGRTYDFGTTVGRVVQHPTRPDAWGLLNTSADRWQVDLPDGRRTEVDPGRSLALIAGCVVHFGAVVGRIEHGA